MAVYICGDSTAADFSTEESMAGWGQVLPVFLPETQVFNHAMIPKAGRTP